MPWHVKNTFDIFKKRKDQVWDIGQIIQAVGPQYVTAINKVFSSSKPLDGFARHHPAVVVAVFDAKCSIL